MKKTIQTILLSLMVFWCPNYALAQGKENGRAADAVVAQKAPPTAKGQAHETPVKEIQGYVGLRARLADQKTLQIEDWVAVTATISWQEDEFHITISTSDGKTIPLHEIYGFIDVNNYHREIKQKAKGWFHDKFPFQITFDRLVTQVKANKGNVELQACYLQLLSTYSKMHVSALVKPDAGRNRFEELMKLREFFWTGRTIYQVSSVHRLLFFYEQLQFCEIELERLKETESDQEKLNEEIVRIGKIAQLCCNELLRCNDEKYRNLQAEHNVAAYDAYVALANPQRSPVKLRDTQDIVKAIELIRAMESHVVRYAKSKAPDHISGLNPPLPSALVEDKTKLLTTEYLRILAKFARLARNSRDQEDAHKEEVEKYQVELAHSSRMVAVREMERDICKAELVDGLKKLAETSAELKKSQKHLVLIVEETEEWKRASLWNAVRAAVESIREQKPFPDAKVFVLAANESRLFNASAGLGEWPTRGKPSRTDYLRTASVDQIGTIGNADPRQCRYLVIAPELASGEITPTKAAGILAECKRHGIQINVLQVLYPFDRRDRHLANLCFQSNGVYSNVEYDPDAIDAEKFGQDLAATIVQIWRPY